ncbi:unnamed protein product [Rotaria sp. Silwood1]|nr:unnamed protein product [Rotaria sp. Silwood1]CAF3640170.1 unnamed protein product [Rotaria sp. Silwood1]CAF4942189.1 unnamed protein product [Rotaria sp. Silwood1]
MMKIVLSLLLFSLCNHLGQCAQPYFPSQIVFSPDDGKTTIAIDEINQRAYLTYPVNALMKVSAYVMQNFPYAVPDSPQSKHYVFLATTSLINFCSYETYWKYGAYRLNQFPLHWGNDSSYKIRNYVNFNSEMIHSNISSNDEDYWYSKEICSTSTGNTYRCQEIYFKKNTDIPLRLAEVQHSPFSANRVITNFTIISIGKPDDEYFDSIPKEWYVACRDVDLGVLYDPTLIRLSVQQSAKVQVWLSAPPHEINGNDTVTIQWKTSQCTDCFTWTPKQLSFNSKNFQEKQTLTITRLRITEQSIFIPILNGGAFDLIEAQTYSLSIR